MKWQSPDFKLQFSSEEIAKYADRYSFAQNDGAWSAGQRIVHGDYSRANLVEIFEWKTKGRGISRILRNSDAEIADALRLAIEAKTDRAAVAVLLGLHGVEISVASAILTAINETQFTIIDFRALEALGVQTVYRSIDLYLAYLAACRGLAAQHGVTLRTLDRALWQWHKEHGKSV